MANLKESAAMTDERLHGASNRASKQTVNRRPSRAAQNRAVKENRNQTDATRMEAFFNSSYNAALPNIPPIPGYHVCWLASNNPKDSLSMRKRWGYEPITPAEMEGFGEFATGKGGDIDGLVHVQEMVAFKLPLHLYQRMMQHNHHDAPAEQDSMLTSQAQQLAAKAKREGSNADLGEGVTDEGLISQMASIEAPDFTADER